MATTAPAVAAFLLHGGLWWDVLSTVSADDAHHPTHKVPVRVYCCGASICEYENICV